MRRIEVTIDAEDFDALESSLRLYERFIDLEMYQISISNLCVPTSFGVEIVFIRRPVDPIV